MTLDIQARSELLKRIEEGLRSELAALGSSLADATSLDRNLAAHTSAILEEVLDGEEPHNPVSTDYAVSREFAVTGVSAAVQDIDPAEPLMAAEVLFSVALQVLHDANLGVDSLQLARRLHHAIWRRFPPGAIAYVDALRQQLAEVRRESLKELSRELHDEILPLLSLATYQLDAFESDEDAEHVDSARDLIRASLDSSQAIAFDIRQSVGRRSLSQALEAHVAIVAESGADIRLSVRGRATVISNRLKEESFAIALEAIRNARRHGDPRLCIAVSLDWALDGLVLEISNGEIGGRTTQTRTTALGLVGMRERAERVGGGLEVTVSPTGTRVRLHVPFRTETP